MMGAVTIVFYSFVLLWLTTAVNSVNVINSDLPLFNTTIKTKNATCKYIFVTKYLPCFSNILKGALTVKFLPNIK